MSEVVKHLINASRHAVLVREKHAMLVQRRLRTRTNEINNNFNLTFETSCK